MCGKCCGRDWPVPADPAERERIAALDLPEVEIPKKKWFRNGFISKKNGKCIFSTCDGKKCIIHAKYGLDVKALACRLYPLDIHAWEDGSISASLRYDCPAVARGTENNIGSAIVKIDSMADEIACYRRDPAPFYSREIQPPLERLREIARTYSAIFEYSGASLQSRFLGAAELLAFHKTAAGRGDILEAEDFEEDALALLERSVENLQDMIGDAEPAAYSSGVLFRYLLLSFLRNDNGLHLFSRLKRLGNHLSFMLGSRELKSSGTYFSPFLRSLPAEKDAFQPYLRWLKGRLYSLHFCGGGAFGITFEEGMQYLLLSLPAVNVIAGAFAQGETLKKDDVSNALIALDYSFLRTKLYRNRSLLKSAALLTDQEHYSSLLKSYGPILKKQ